MPYPPVTALPPAASRTGDPANFPGESQLFLAAFPTWRTQSNALEAYVDAAPLNIWNWGTLADINPMLATLPVISARPTIAGLAWASAQDLLWSTLQSASAAQNALGAFIDAISALTGSAVDPDRPFASTIATAPTRGQATALFNSTSQAFYDSAANYVTTINIVAVYFNEAIAPDTYGVIGEPITLIDDWGTL